MAPVQPKKPVGGAYGAFLSEKRPEFTKACAGQKASAISTMAGEGWKKLSDEEKAPYQKTYEAAKAQYEKDFKEFTDAGGVKEKGAAAMRKEKRNAKDGKENGEDGKKKKKVKDADAPKKPCAGGFGQYLNENRLQIKQSLPADHKITDISKKAGELWRAVSETDKKPFEEKFRTKMAEYKAAMEEYKKTHGADAGDEDGEGAEGKEDDDAAPRKRARTEKTETEDKKETAKEEKATLKEEKAKLKLAKLAMKSVPRATGKAKAKTPAGPPAPELESAVAMKAEAAELTEKLLLLVARQDVIDSGKSQNQVLKALQDSGGLIHPARRALLGA